MNQLYFNKKNPPSLLASLPPNDAQWKKPHPDLNQLLPPPPALTSCVFLEEEHPTY